MLHELKGGGGGSFSMQLPIPLNGAYNSPFYIRGAVMGFLNGKSIIQGTQGTIPYTLLPTDLLISILPAPQLNVKRIIWRGLKVCPPPLKFLGGECELFKQ